VVVGNSLAGDIPLLSAAGRFDAILTNPPYVKEYAHRAAFDGARHLPGYQGKADLWHVFTCRAVDLLAEGGVLAVIGPANWVSNYGARAMRQFVLARATLRLFADFGDAKVFPGAGIQTMVLLAEKGPPPPTYECEVRRMLATAPTSAQIADFLSPCPCCADDSPAFAHFAAPVATGGYDGRPLSLWDPETAAILAAMAATPGVTYLTPEEVANGVDPHQTCVTPRHLAMLGTGSGVHAGEGIFLLSDEEKMSIPFSAAELAFVQPFYTAEQLGRYYANSNHTHWLLVTPSDMNARIADFPNIQQHLDRFRPVLTSDFAPYGIHRARDSAFFAGPRVLSLRKCTRPTFSFVDFPAYVGQAYYVIKSPRFDPKVLVALLNSSAVAFWLRHAGKMQGGLFQVDAEPLLGIPLPPSPPVLATIADYVILLRSAGEPTAFWEDLVDTIVLELYFFDRFAADDVYLPGVSSLLESLPELPVLPPDCNLHTLPPPGIIADAEHSIAGDSILRTLQARIAAHPWAQRIYPSISPHST
jgi:adenine-specific DNA-methyltransferase